MLCLRRGAVRGADNGAALELGQGGGPGAAAAGGDNVEAADDAEPINDPELKAIGVFAAINMPCGTPLKQHF